MGATEPTEPAAMEGSQEEQSGKLCTKRFFIVASVIAVVMCLVGFGAGFAAGWFSNDDDDDQVILVTPEPTPPPKPVSLLLQTEGTVAASQHLLIGSAVQKVMFENDEMVDVKVTAVCSLETEQLRGLSTNSYIPQPLLENPAVCNKAEATHRSMATTAFRVTIIQVVLVPRMQKNRVAEVAALVTFFEMLEKEFVGRGFKAFVFAFLRGECGNGKETKISAVQGSGTSSKMVDQAVTIEGVVVGHADRGYFVQEEQEDYDNSDETSEGIYVMSSDRPALGMHVRVTGNVTEYYGLTALEKVEKYTMCTFSKRPPVPLPLDVTKDNMEHREGMLVRVTTPLVVSGTTEMWKYGSLELAPTLLRHPTDVAIPSSTKYQEQVKANAVGRLVLEDTTTASYPKTLPFLINGTEEAGPVVTLGAKVESELVGALGFGYGDWRLVPHSPVKLSQARAPLGKVQLPHGDLRIASFNVLNYFNGKKVSENETTFDFSGNRGATSQAAFDLQSKKIESALLSLDADVIALTEIENDGFGEDSAINTLATRVNARQPNTNKHYKYIDVQGGSVGTDVIMPAIMYREEVVVPKGSAWIVDMPTQKYVLSGKTRTGWMRPVLVQTFTDMVSGQEFAVAVVHLRSKGGSCYEDSIRGEPLDSENYAQRGCNPLRVSAAMVLGEALEKAALPPRVLILGDFNSYTMEDPMAVLTDYTPATRGYTILTADKIVAPGDNESATEGSLTPQNVSKSFGYVNLGLNATGVGYTINFDGMVGSLDHVLASSTLAPEVKGATRWGINAGEVYEMEYTKALERYPGYVDETPYRSSDHNPVLISLSMPSVNTGASTLTLLHINDHHSRMEGRTGTLDASSLGLATKDAEGAAVTSVTVPYGGFPRLVSLYELLEREAAKRGNGVLRLHAGDAITGSMYYTMFEGMSDADVMNVICFDAYSLGNHEFDEGDAGLARFLNMLEVAGVCNTPVLAANVVPGGDSPLNGLLQPYVVKRVRGVEVGIIGVITAKTTKESSNPDPDTTFLQETSTVQKYIDQLQEKGVKRIVVLSHVGHGQDLSMARALRGADVVVGGHSHTLLGNTTSLSGLGMAPRGDYPRVVTGADGKSVCVVQAWEYGNVIGQMDIDFDAAGDVVKCSGSPYVPVGKTVTYRHANRDYKTLGGEDTAKVLKGVQALGEEMVVVDENPFTVAALAKYTEKMESKKKEVVGVASEDLCLDGFPGQFGKCPNNDTYEHGSEISMVVVKAYLNITKTADFAIQNMGGVREMVKEGDITLAEVHSILPFSNTLMTLTLTGDEIKKSLEEALSYPLDKRQSSGSFPYAYGLRYVVNASASNGNRIVNLEGNSRMKGQWAPLDPAKSYVVVTNDYIGQGKDGYQTFGTVSKEGRFEFLYKDYVQALVDYLRLLRAGGEQVSPLPVSERSVQRYIDTKGCDHSARKDCTGL